MIRLRTRAQLGRDTTFIGRKIQILRPKKRICWPKNLTTPSLHPNYALSQEQALNNPQNDLIFKKNQNSSIPNTKFLQKNKTSHFLPSKTNIFDSASHESTNFPFFSRKHNKTSSSSFSSLPPFLNNITHPDTKNYSSLRNDAKL